MWVVVYVFFYLEHLIVSLQVHADTDVQRLILFSKVFVIRILNISACKLFPLVDVHILLYELPVKVFYVEIFALKVYYWSLLPFLVNEDYRTNASLFGDKSIVGTKVRRNMHDTRTVVSGDIVAWYHSEGIAHRLDCRHELFILHIHKVRTLVAANDLPGNYLVALLISAQFLVASLFAEIRADTSLCQSHRDRLGGIGVVCLDCHVVYLRSHAERRVSSQSPWCCCPCEEVWSSPPYHLLLRSLYPELCRTCSIFHVTVASRLVQLVARQSRSCCWRIWLNGIPLI